MSSSNASPPSSYQELSQTQTRDLDPNLAKLVPDINTEGGDITRNLTNDPSNNTRDKLRRSSSFSNFLDESRRNSTASDINIPGGFRRQYIINQSIQNNQSPPKFLTNNLIEFLNIYLNFAGEEFDEDSDYDNDHDDEESLLLSEESPNYYTNMRDNNNGPLTSHVTPGKSKHSSKYHHKSQSDSNKSSDLKTYFLVFKSLVGSGILFLPKAFCNGGLLFSIITLNVFGFITYICYLLLISAKNHLKMSSFGELGFKTYGNPLKILVSMSIIITQVGFVSTYILFATENLSKLFSINQFNLVIIQFILLIPLILIRKISKLSIISLISSIFIVIGLFIIFYYSIYNLIENHLGPNIIQFNSNSWSMLVGVAVTSFEGIGLILPIESSMEHPDHFPKILAISVALITGLFSAIGVLGYLSFGDQVKSIILLNLPYNNMSIKIILILYSLAVFLTTPLQLFPAIKILESMVFNSKVFWNNGKLYNSGKFNPKIKWLKNFTRVMFLLLICVIAYANFNNIDKFVSFNGCFACIPLVYIYPPLIHLKTLKTRPRDSSTSFKMGFDYVMVVMGVITMVYSTYQILFLN